MSFPQDQLDELGVFGTVSVVRDGGRDYPLICGCAMPAGCVPDRVDVMLCPYPRDGYETRLFFAQRVNGKKNVNWHQRPRMLDRNWEVYSLKGIPASFRLAAMLVYHLEALA